MAAGVRNSVDFVESIREKKPPAHRTSGRSLAVGPDGRAVVKRKPQGRPYAAPFDELHSSQEMLNNTRAAVHPDGSYRQSISGERVPVEDAVGPHTTPFDVFRVIANHVDHGLEDAESDGLPILRHKGYVTAPFAADLAHKLGEGRSFGQVEDGIRFAAVTISSRDHRQVQLATRSDYVFIFIPRAQSVQF